MPQLRTYLLLIILAFLTVQCSTKALRPGTGGRGDSRLIEKGDHPEFPDGVSCYVCHKDEIPANEFHNKFGKNCDQCHVKTTWMAEKYPHNEWPLNEIHNVRCTRCHTQANVFNFKHYQCYGCHHEADNMAEAHPTLTTEKLLRCVECHKEPKKEVH